MKKENKVFNPQGFTFIEIIIYTAIVSIMLSGLIIFASNIIRSGAKSATQQETSATARYVSERIKYEIRNSLGINTGTSNFDVNLANNSSHQLSIQSSEPNDPTIFNVLNGKVQIKQGMGTAVPLNSNDTTVTDLTFTNNTSSDSKTKNISFTLTITDNYTGQRQEYQSSISLRSSAEIRSN